MALMMCVGLRKQKSSSLKRFTAGGAVATGLPLSRPKAKSRGDGSWHYSDGSLWLAVKVFLSLSLSWVCFCFLRW